MLPMCQLKVKITVKGQIFNKQYYTLCRVRSITPLLMEGFSSNLNDTFTLSRGCAEPMFFPQHILPLLPLYNFCMNLKVYNYLTKHKLTSPKIYTQYDSSNECNVSCKNLTKNGGNLQINIISCK